MPDNPDLKIIIKVDQTKAVADLRSFYTVQRQMAQEHLNATNAGNRALVAGATRTSRDILTIYSRASREVAEVQVRNVQTMVSADSLRVKSAQAVSRNLLTISGNTVQGQLRDLDVLRQAVAKVEQENRAEAQRTATVRTTLSRRSRSVPFVNPATPATPSPASGGGGLFGGVATGNFAANLATRAFDSLAQGAKESIELAADFEQTLSVLGTQSKATSAQLEEMAKTARDLGADLDLPATSANDALKSMLALSQGGLSAVDSMNATRGVLTLVAAKNLDVAKAAQITARALNAFGLEGSKAADVAGMLVAASDASGRSVQNMGEAIAAGASIYHQAGFSLRDFLTDVTLMQKAGLSGQLAATALKVAIQNLTAPTPQAAAEMRKLGLVVYDANGKLVDHDELIRRITKALAGKSDADRNAAGRVIFGSNAIQAMNLVLSRGVELNQKMAGVVGDVNKGLETAKSRMSGFNGAVDGLNSALDTFKEENAQPFLKYLTNIVNGASHGLEKLRELRKEISEHNNAPRVANYTGVQQQPKSAEDARMNAGLLRIYRRVVGEEISVAKTGSIPPATGLQNNLNEAERAQVIGVLMQKYGLPRDHNIQALEAVAARLSAEIARYEKQSTNLPSANAPKAGKPGAPKPKPFLYDTNAVSLSGLGIRYDEGYQAYQDKYSLSGKKELESISGQIESRELTAAKKRYEATKKTEDDNTKYLIEQGQIAARRRDRDQSLDRVEAQISEREKKDQEQKAKERAEARARYVKQYQKWYADRVSAALTEQKNRDVAGIKNRFDTTTEAYEWLAKQPERAGLDKDGKLVDQQLASMQKELTKTARVLSLSEADKAYQTYWAAGGGMKFDAKTGMPIMGADGKPFEMNPEAYEKLQTELQSINQKLEADVKKIDKVITDRQQKNRDDAVETDKGVAVARAEYQQEQIAKVIDGVIDSLVTFNNGVTQIAPQSPGSVAQNAALYENSVQQAGKGLLRAARTGRQTDLADAMNSFDGAQIYSGDRGAVLAAQFEALQNTSGMAGSKLRGRESAPLVRRWLQQMQGDANSLGNDALSMQIGEALKEWEAGMKSSAEIFADGAIDHLSEGARGVLASLIDGDGDIEKKLENLGRTLMGSITGDIANSLSDDLSRSLKAKLSKAFLDGKMGFADLFKSAEVSALRIAATGYSLLQAIMAASKGNSGSLIGGILGGIAGAFIPGIGIPSGFAIGSALGRQDYASAALGFFGTDKFGSLISQGSGASSTLNFGSGKIGSNGGGGLTNLGGLGSGSFSGGGLSRAVGSGGGVVLNQYHYGDNYDKSDLAAQNQQMTDEITGVLARI